MVAARLNLPQSVKNEFLMNDMLTHPGIITLWLHHGVGGFDICERHGVWDHECQAMHSACWL